jgi:hypothetical protein
VRFRIEGAFTIPGGHSLAGIEGTLRTLSTDLTAERDAHYSKLNRCHGGASQRSLNMNGGAAREMVEDLREIERLAWRVDSHQAREERGGYQPAWG